MESSLRATDHERVPRDAILNSLREGIVVTAADGTTVMWNDAAGDFLGLGDDATAQSVAIDAHRAVIDPRGYPIERERYPVNRAFATGEAAEETVGITSPQGVRWFHVTSAPLERAEDGSPPLVLTTMVDVSSRREAEAAAAVTAERARQRYEVAFQNAPIGMLELDGTGRVLAANAAVHTLFDASPGTLVGGDVCGLLGVDDIALLVERSGAEDSSHTMSDPHGDRHLFVRMAALDSDAPEGGAWLLQVADLTASRRLEDQLRHLAAHDPLTGLLNRRSFGDALDDFASTDHRDADHGVLIVLDLDNFKAINDTSGHGAGDEAIVTVADALRHRLRERDLICRLGGDEFAILAPDCRREHAEELAKAAIDAVRTCTVELRNGETRRLGASAGVVPWSPRHRSADAMLADADKALYEAKDRGRDTVVVLDATDDRRRTNSPLSWIDRIESALDAGEFELDAQPIMDLFDGTISQYELLIRMIGPDGTRIPPGPWMPVAERVGLFHRIDRWVCDQAIDLLTRYDHVLEVNLSGRSLGNATLLEAIANRLEDEDVDPSRLIFEVTETGAVTNLTEAQGFLSELRSLGCRFALDDFGAGFGSFYYLKHLPFDFVKIDGEFVRGCDTDAADRSVIRSVVDIASELGAHVVAEHVQTTEVLHTIVSLGVRYGQGYLLGAPAPVSTTFEEIERSRAATGTNPS